ncbi:UPF0481 protein At3g47200-like [Camellia sinensis]|uniref:UPF0481 protein At3g47200-like n=1 Tax=Camellia sinensis TaxID=4442 RepID=UPI001036F284|nr:UPF0481 protein At3g47200-like [Camellia sinensis]
MLVSIGPYHHGQPKLLAIEKHKEHFLELLLQHNNNHRKEDYLDCMNKLEKRARKDYVDPVHHLDSDEFVKMMLYDTCFVTEFLLELLDASVKFEAREERNQSMFNIHFEHGHFKIPKFKVTDSTETFFRNIIAYEQHSSDDKSKYFTDYMYFMDQLINCKENVTQLRCHEVLENWLGDG